MSRYAIIPVLFALSCSSTPGSSYTPPSFGPPKPEPGQVQAGTECQTNEECTAKLTLATCQTGRCELGKCVARNAALGTSCALDVGSSASVTVGECQGTLCDGEGHCGLYAAPDGSSCGASDACARKACVEGVCKDAKSPECFDGNPCTTDTCDPVTGCLFVPNTDPCDDGNVCSSGDACKDGFCVAGKPVCECLTDGDCKGKDKNLCDGPFVCKDKKCVNDDTKPVVCDALPELGPCQAAECVPASGTCTAVPTPAAACDDGNACTDGDYCSDAGICIAGKKTVCEKCTGGIDEDGDKAVDCDDDDCTADLVACPPPPPPADDGPIDQDAGSPAEDTTPIDPDAAAPTDDTTT